LLARAHYRHSGRLCEQIDGVMSGKNAIACAAVTFLTQLAVMPARPSPAR
jgi:hypothetical protein